MTISMRLPCGLSVVWLVVLLGTILRFLWGGRPGARRQFLRNAALGAVGAVLALLTAGFGLLLWPNKTGAFGSEITQRTDYTPDQAVPYPA